MIGTGAATSGALPGRIEDHLPALAAEQCDDVGHLVAHVLLERLKGCVVQPHHGRVQREDGMLRDDARAGRLVIDDRAHEVR